MKNSAEKRKNTGNDNIYILKWIAFISGFLILGGAFSFALILLTAYLLEGERQLNPIWIVGVIPLMFLIAIPISFILYHQIKKNLSVLLNGMQNVADGDLDTYIPENNAKDFKKVYQNFNKMVAQMRGAEVLRVNMFDNLSHELKTPIATISGFSKILAEKDLSEDKKQKYLKIIYEESERLGELVKNILLLSKLDSQEIVIHKEEYNLTKQLQDCIIGLESEWSSKNIDISADLAPVKYIGEQQLIKSLWINLISNAIKFTPKNGEINIKLFADDNNIIFSVSDSGIGIEKEHLDQIFEKHFQVDKKISGGGQGLGLPIVKRIAELCQGNIAVKSTVGEGSIFTVTLPR